MNTKISLMRPKKSKGAKRLGAKRSGSETTQFLRWTLPASGVNIDTCFAISHVFEAWSSHLRVFPSPDVFR